MRNTTFHKKSSSSSSSDGPIIPDPDSRSTGSRTVVLCFDGTGDQFCPKNSNVVQLFSMLVKHHPSQVVYYQSGIGTYTIPEIATPFMAKISKTVDMMFGKHLDAHVMGGYEFLMQNYQGGDKICIFGFSRGAYTARALAGMVDRIGLIPSWNHQQVPFAYHIYSSDGDCKAFKGTFSIPVNIEFVGVWDTVSSVGFIPKLLPFSRASNCIKYFRHALSLDERRVRFKPNTWHHPHKGGETTNVQEVWFAGAHCGMILTTAEHNTDRSADVGGGSVLDGTPNSLARIPLRWMIRECFKANVGILFHQDLLIKIGMDPAKLDLNVYKRPDIVYEDAADAVSKTHDQLKKAWWWWILEFTPQPVYYKDDADADDDVIIVGEMKVNMGNGRSVSQRHSIKVHRSVQTRMEKMHYVPKAKVDLSKVNDSDWVD